MVGTDARSVVHSLDDATAGELRTLAVALELGGGAFEVFAPALANLACSRDAGRGHDALDELSMRVALKRARVRLAADEGARARLEAADEPFWVAVRAALDVDG